MAVPDKGEYPIKLGTFLFTMVEPHTVTSSSISKASRPVTIR